MSTSKSHDLILIFSAKQSTDKYAEQHRINFQMKKFGIILALILAACSSSGYDGGEYLKIVNLIISIDNSPTFCNSKSLKKNVETMVQDTHYIVVYNSGQPNNTDTIKLFDGVEDEVKRFQTMVSDQPISPTYCSLKLKSISDTLKVILRAEGSKSR